MAKQESSLGTVLTIGALGVGGYFLWNWLTTPTATTAAPAPAPSPTMPQSSPVGSNVTGTNPPLTTTVGPTTTAQVGAQALDNLYNQLIALGTQNAPATGVGANNIQLVNGQLQMNFSAWNYYLAQIDPGLPTLPDYQTVAGSPDPNTAISGPAYWSLMSPWLSSNAPGLSGLGFFGGLGAVSRIARGRR